MKTLKWFSEYVEEEEEEEAGEERDLEALEEEGGMDVEVEDPYLEGDAKAKRRIGVRLGGLSRRKSRKRKTSFTRDFPQHSSSSKSAHKSISISLSDETKVSFVVPPDTPTPFHIRYRVNVDKKLGVWRNPLTHMNGAFFSPKLKVKLSQQESLERTRNAKRGRARGSNEVEEVRFRVPPPILLSKAWERNNIVNLYNTNKRAVEAQTSKQALSAKEKSSRSTKANDDETEPPMKQLLQRVYTLSGLTPSVEKGGSWASWAVNTAGQGFYGIRRVQIQFASEIHEFADESSGDVVKLVKSYAELGEEDWQLLPMLEYRVPSSDIFSTFLFMGLNWMKSTGIKQLEQTLVGELERNRSRNSVVVKQFVKEVLVKLRPVWENSVVPWLEKDRNLQYILKENRESKIRELLIQLMTLLQKNKLIQTIPSTFHSIKPRLVDVTVEALTDKDSLPVSQSEDGLAVEAMEKKKGKRRYRVSPGTKIRIKVTAATSGLDQRDVDRQLINRGESKGFTQPLKIWFAIYNKKTRRYLDLLDDDIIPEPGALVQGPGRKLRANFVTAVEVHGTDKEGDTSEQTFQGEFVLNGVDKYGNVLVEHGSTLHVKVIVEQFSAHVDAIEHLKLKYRFKASEEADSDSEQAKADPKKKLPSESSFINVEDQGLGSQLFSEKPVRRSYVKVLSTPKTRLQISDMINDLRALEEYETVVITNRALLTSLMGKLGNNLTQYDLDEVQKHLGELIAGQAGAASGGGTEAARYDSFFVDFYVDSKYNQGMVDNVFEQLNETLVSQKNVFLEKTLKIPTVKMREIAKSKSLLALPERQLLVSHGTGLAKSFLCNKYKNILERPMEAPSSELMPLTPNGTESGPHDKDGTGDAQSTSDTPATVSYVNLNDQDAVEQASLTTFLRTFARNVLFIQLGRNLPEPAFQSSSYRAMFGSNNDLVNRSVSSSSFNDTLANLKANSDHENSFLRNQWISEAIESDMPVADALKETFIWSLVNFYREYRARRTQASRELEQSKQSKLEQKRLRQERLQDFLDNATIADVLGRIESKLGDHNADRENDVFEDIAISDLFSFVTKNVLKTEVEAVLRELIPQVSKSVSEQVIPAIARGVISGIRSVLWKNKVRIFLTVTSLWGFGYCCLHPEAAMSTLTIAASTLSSRAKSFRFPKLAS